MPVPEPSLPSAARPGPPRGMQSPPPHRWAQGSHQGPRGRRCLNCPQTAAEGRDDAEAGSPPHPPSVARWPHPALALVRSDPGEKGAGPGVLAGRRCAGSLRIRCLGKKASGGCRVQVPGWGSLSPLLCGPHPPVPPPRGADQSPGPALIDKTCQQGSCTHPVRV